MTEEYRLDIVNIEVEAWSVCVECVCVCVQAGYSICAFFFC